jgi:hypothetical protein
MFYMVVRIFRTSQDNNSIQYFNVSDYESQDACLRAAEARFHNIITADLQNPDVVYQMTYILDNAGNFTEKPVIFDRRGE